MIEEIYIETYLFISPNEYKIFLFDTKNLKNLYNKELKFDDNKNSIDLKILNNFLDNNIFKIEKLVGKFIKNIFLILEINETNILNIGFKKKNYENTISEKFLREILIEAKDIFRENYQNKKILHLLIDKYLINGKSYEKFENNLKSDHLCVETKFISISNDVLFEIDKVLEKYQIKIIRYLDNNYIKKFFKNENIGFSYMVFKILKGCNYNEVLIVPKNSKKLGFFEKFFQLFS